MTVLSLFDGMSCGRVALERVGITPDTYYSSEIDKYAIQISKKNWPDIIQLGDVTKWREWDIDFAKIDLLLAGFPCQAWSMAGKQKGDNDPRGALVHDLIDIWREIKKYNPDVYFLFENVEMKEEHLRYVNNLFGCSPVVINSALVSAQNRVRYYWTNLPGDEVDLFGDTYITQPKDKGILLRDVLEDAESQRDKSQTILSTLHKENVKSMKKRKKTGLYVCRRIVGRKINPETGKAVEEENYRKITPLECERLQTLDDNYTHGVSKTQRYKMIGNGWTVDVIAHIMKGLKMEAKA